MPSAQALTPLWARLTPITHLIAPALKQCIGPVHNQHDDAGDEVSMSLRVLGGDRAQGFMWWPRLSIPPTTVSVRPFIIEVKASASLASRLGLEDKLGVYSTIYVVLNFMLASCS